MLLKVQWWKSLKQTAVSLVQLISFYKSVSYARPNSCIRGYHIYQYRWLPIIGKPLECRRELGNPRDRYALALCETTATCHFNIVFDINFNRRVGAMYSIVLGDRSIPETSPRRNVIHKNASCTF